MPESRTIAILGGTGALGSGLARRWAVAGHRVLIGSRRREKAQEAVEALRARLPATCPPPQGLDNATAAAAAEIAVLTVPYAHQLATLEGVREALRGKILVDVTVPLKPPKVAVVHLPEEGSAALRAQHFLGPEVRVVSAFQNVAADLLASDGPIDCDVLVTGDDREAREQVLTLVRDAGLRGFHAGPLANAVAAEALTPVLIAINRQFKCHAGIRITGVPDS
ncbi:MAG: NADPH-dependent F420 reductase [Porticoccaceae bacterium]|nr:MAG: NADPH-dependent F420 reductase [Porticoccaceae bacterium]